MARNQGREFATMDDDERRRFAQEQGGEASGQPELNFDDPRNADKMGQQSASLEQEFADPENRDGGAAQLDEVAHDRAAGRRAAKPGRGARRDRGT